MKRFAILSVLAAFTMVISSCSNDDEPNFHFTALRALSAEVPESFELNERYQITVTFERPDGCTFFEGFDVTSPDTTVRDVVVIGSVFTDRACTTEVEEIEVSFDFVVIHDQTYTFRFYEGQDDEGEHQFFEITVPVN
ncbi:hypothetical protein FGM00_17395 [Aggregatimonas sangjinii]|uniref:DUF4625 domain-containing protein n=2 Tax=Aggregatimonas sangjinii TaxID=2583587 RepID=A0A5B7SV41_9FLAO|nr:hypothetical protein FGM00_17395 [Aggregatimonas sangjinii]